MSRERCINSGCFLAPGIAAMLLRISSLTHLNKNQTPGEHCVSMIKKTDEYKNAKTLDSKRGMVIFHCGS